MEQIAKKTLFDISFYLHCQNISFGISRDSRVIVTKIDNITPFQICIVDIETIPLSVLHSLHDLDIFVANDEDEIYQRQELISHYIVHSLTTSKIFYIPELIYPFKIYNPILKSLVHHTIHDFFKQLNN